VKDLLHGLNHKQKQLKLRAYPYIPLWISRHGEAERDFLAAESVIQLLPRHLSSSPPLVHRLITYFLRGCHAIDTPPNSARFRSVSSRCHHHQRVVPGGCFPQSLSFLRKSKRKLKRALDWTSQLTPHPSGKASKPVHSAALRRHVKFLRRAVIKSNQASSRDGSAGPALSPHARTMSRVHLPGFAFAA
jgi:hypothetical protein